jgi:hypothetical protein
MLGMTVVMNRCIVLFVVSDYIFFVHDSPAKVTDTMEFNIDAPHAVSLNAQLARVVWAREY